MHVANCLFLSAGASRRADQWMAFGFNFPGCWEDLSEKLLVLQSLQVLQAHKLVIISVLMLTWPLNLISLRLIAPPGLNLIKFIGTCGRNYQQHLVMVVASR